MLTTLGALRSTSARPTARGRPSVQLRSGRWQCEQEIWPFEESLRSKNSRSPRSTALLLPETRLLGSGVQGAGQGPCAAIRRTSSPVNAGAAKAAALAAPSARRAQNPFTRCYLSSEPLSDQRRRGPA